MAVERFVSADAAEAAAACARHMIARLEEALRERPSAALAISGGSSPRPVFQALAAAPLDWTRIHLFWVDERMVPPEDPQSNYGMARRSLIEPAGIPEGNVHRVRGELAPHEAARLYAAGIRSALCGGDAELPRFDVIHCGIGADGHTASLFPGEALIGNRNEIAAEVYVEKMSQWRVTLLPGVLLAARDLVVYSVGADKGGALRRIFDGPYDPGSVPAQLLALHGRNVAWFLDDAAASAALLS
jgi:6-phosphogluconolactonase